LRKRLRDAGDASLLLDDHPEEVALAVSGKRLRRRRVQAAVRNVSHFS
jgi:hypothetical protein